MSKKDYPKVQLIKNLTGFLGLLLLYFGYHFYVMTVNSARAMELPNPYYRPVLCALSGVALIVSVFLIMNRNKLGLIVPLIALTIVAISWVILAQFWFALGLPVIYFFALQQPSVKEYFSKEK